MEMDAAKLLFYERHFNFVNEGETLWLLRRKTFQRIYLKIQNIGLYFSFNGYVLSFFIRAVVKFQFKIMTWIIAYFVLLTQKFNLFA